MVSIYIQSVTTERVGVVVEQNEVKELVIDRPTSPNQVGNIFIAKVVKIEKGLQAAFVDIGQQKLGFLQRKELPKAPANKNLPIESIITEGQKIIVQIQKDAYGDKGTRLTANIALPGTDIVYLPYGNYVASSKKLPDVVRNELRRQVDQIRIGEEGAIVRTTAKGRSMEEIEQVFINLRERWIEMEKSANKQPVPSCIFADEAVSDRLIRKFNPQTVEGIYVDNIKMANRIRENYPNVKDIVYWEKDIDSRLPKTIRQMIDEVVSPRVQTSGGVELYIEQTEAMTVIDVNTAAYTGKGNKEQTIVHANRYAAIAVAQQIRLRNLSGIIIIDFIGMKKQAQKEQVLKILQQELAKDPVRTEVFGFTQLGLVEMTRKRESQSLVDLFLDKEQQKSKKISPVTYAFLLERELMSYKDSEVEALFVEVNQNIYQAFLAEVGLEKLRKSTSQEVFLKRSKGITSYQVKLAGSKQLIEEHLATISTDNIDKV